MENVTLPSGHTLVVHVASFAAANKLRKALASELGSVAVDVDLSKLKLELDVRALGSRELNTVKNVICRLLSSDVIEAAVFDCAAKCTLEKQRITRDLFDAEELRGDLIPMAQEVIKANVAPFFASLDLKSLIGSAAPSEGQPSG